MKNPSVEHAARIEEIVTADRRDTLAHSSPLRQAEAIAMHYVSNFANARDLLELVRAQRVGAGNVTFNEAIAFLVEGFAESIKLERRP
jgi:hypothetical protein